MINPNNSGGNVERWLVEVEIMMKKSLAYAIDSSMVDHASRDRLDWVQQWAGQVTDSLKQHKYHGLFGLGSSWKYNLHGDT